MLIHGVSTVLLISKGGQGKYNKLISKYEANQSICITNTATMKQLVFKHKLNCS
uniref:Uncharacterized protein n=1 Tax=Arundo donax TaxID=35708 RepID=A0A0A9A4G5_ARUDO